MRNTVRSRLLSGLQGERSGRAKRARPGPLFVLASLGAALVTAAVVVSAAVDLGHTHWGAALVAVPLAVAVLVIARFAYPWLVTPAAAAVALLLAAIATGGLVAWSGDALVGGGAPRRRRRRLARRVAPHVRPLATRRAPAVRPLARLRDADEAAHHGAAAHHRGGRHVRRRGRLARGHRARRDAARPGAGVRGC